MTSEKSFIDYWYYWLPVLLLGLSYYFKWYSLKEFKSNEVLFFFYVLGAMGIFLWNDIGKNLSPKCVSLLHNFCIIPRDMIPCGDYYIITEGIHAPEVLLTYRTNSITYVVPKTYLFELGQNLHITGMPLPCKLEELSAEIRNMIVARKLNQSNIWFAMFPFYYVNENPDLLRVQQSFMDMSHEVNVKKAYAMGNTGLLEEWVQQAARVANLRPKNAVEKLLDKLFGKKKPTDEQDE